MAQTGDKTYRPALVGRKKHKRPFSKDILKVVGKDETTAPTLFDALFVENIKQIKANKENNIKRHKRTLKQRKQLKPFGESLKSILNRIPEESSEFELDNSFDKVLKGKSFQPVKYIEEERTEQRNWHNKKTFMLTPETTLSYLVDDLENQQPFRFIQTRGAVARKKAALDSEDILRTLKKQPKLKPKSRVFETVNLSVLRTKQAAARSRKLKGLGESDVTVTRLSGEGTADSDSSFIPPECSRLCALNTSNTDSNQRVTRRRSPRLNPRSDNGVAVTKAQVHVDSDEEVLLSVDDDHKGYNSSDFIDSPSPVSMLSQRGKNSLGQRRQLFDVSVTRRISPPIIQSEEQHDSEPTVGALNEEPKINDSHKGCNSPDFIESPSPKHMKLSRGRSFETKEGERPPGFIQKRSALAKEKPPEVTEDDIPLAFLSLDHQLGGESRTVFTRSRRSQDSEGAPSLPRVSGEIIAHSEKSSDSGFVSSSKEVSQCSSLSVEVPEGTVGRLSDINLELLSQAVTVRKSSSSHSSATEANSQEQAIDSQPTASDEDYDSSDFLESPSAVNKFRERVKQSVGGVHNSSQWSRSHQWSRSQQSSQFNAMSQSRTAVIPELPANKDISEQDEEEDVLPHGGVQNSRRWSHHRRLSRTLVALAPRMTIVEDLCPEEDISEDCGSESQLDMSMMHKSFSHRLVLPMALESYSKSNSTSFRSFFVNSTANISVASIPGEQDEENEKECEPSITARDMVLQRCGQTEPLAFVEAFPDRSLKKCKKIGEGVYGEVFSLERAGCRPSVLKIIPIEGDLVVNGEQQKTFEEILSEIVIAMELSELRQGTTFRTSGFSELIRCWCVRGCYPSRLITLWHQFDKQKGSENDTPEVFTEDQLFIILELANAGSDLEGYVLNSADQALAVFVQVANTLAVAEGALEFEHRDLHWGNILLSPTTDKIASFVLEGKEYQVPTKGIKVVIIDFTLSRMTYDACCIYNNLAQDPSLFTSQGDFQFEVYRLMQRTVQNDWQLFRPYTNVLWLFYVLDKIEKGVRYQKTNTKVHRTALAHVKQLKKKMLDFASATAVMKSDAVSM